MKKFLVGCSLLVVLSGCTKYVNVPVWVCPAPTMPAKSLLHTDGIVDKASTADKIKAMVWDLKYLKGLTLQYETILEGYRRPPAEYMVK